MTAPGTAVLTLLLVVLLVIDAVCRTTTPHPASSVTRRPLGQYSHSQ